MKFETSRYSIRKLALDGEFADAKYEMNLKNGWCFSDGSCVAYASSYDELKWIIADIEPDVPCDIQFKKVVRNNA